MTTLTLQDVISSRVVAFDVYGVPAPKGSTKAMPHRATGRIIVTETNKHTRPWAALVTDAAKQAAGGAIAFTRGAAVHLTVTFILPRPASLPKRVQHHTKKPDLDKLTRALKDALTGVVWQDDSQVVHVAAHKRYAGLDEMPGARVAVEQAGIRQ
jgi:crossover junction endodeoxyribonuclease RusA